MTEAGCRGGAPLLRWSASGEREEDRLNIWFWAWLLLAGIFAAMEAFDRRWLTLPFAFGAASAAVLDALRVPVGWEWAAFVLVSSAILVGVQRFVRPSRKALRRAGRAARP